MLQRAVLAEFSKSHNMLKAAHLPVLMLQKAAHFVTLLHVPWIPRLSSNTLLLPDNRVLCDSLTMMLTTGAALLPWLLPFVLHNYNQNQPRNPFTLLMHTYY